MSTTKFRLQRFDSWEDEQRAQLRRALLVIASAIVVASVVGAAVSHAAGWQESFWIMVVFFLSTIVCLALGRRGHERAATVTALVLLVLALCAIASRGYGAHDLSMVAMPSAIVVAALVLGNRGFLAFTAMTILAAVLVGLARWLEVPNDSFRSNAPAQLAVLATALLLSAVASRSLANQLVHGWRRAKDNEARYRAIFESIQEVYFELRHDGILLEVSPAGRGLFKTDRASMIGTSLATFFQDPEQLPILLRNLETACRVSNHSLTLVDTEGQPHHVLLSASLSQDEPESAKIVGSIRDVTDRRALEEQLAQAQKMESIALLAGGVAHDFNNLLTVINGNCELAAVQIEKGRDPTSNLEQIHTAGQKAQALTGSLLAFSRKQAFSARTIDVGALLSQVEPMIRTLIGEDIRIDRRHASDSPPIEADPGQLEQVVINLLVNARDAINAKTNRASEKLIVVSTRPQDLQAPEHGVLEARRHLCLEVTDNGIGMTPEVMSRVFEPFFTTKPSGTGLGLATVYGIVTQNRGMVEIDSTPGAGTTVRVVWPASASRPEQLGGRAEQSARGTEGILLVEDDPAVRRFAASALESRGFRVFPAANGVQALELLIREGDAIDLVVTDVVMPEMDGKELAERARTLRPRLRVVFTSGYTEDRISHHGALDDGLVFIQKPYTANDLACCVRDALDVPWSAVRHRQGLET